MKLPKVKPRKTYKEPEDFKYVVVTNPWPKPIPDSRSSESAKQRFANNIGRWFERMLGKPVPALSVFFQTNKTFIIVELDIEVNVDPILGAHHMQDFITNHTWTDSEISEIYYYDYVHQGSPNTILRWDSVYPNYQQSDLANFYVKEEYPPPRKPKAGPATHFAISLPVHIEESIVERRAAYEESLARSRPPPSAPAPTGTSAPNVSDSLTAQPASAPAHAKPSPNDAFIPYQPPAALAAMRANRDQLKREPQDVDVKPSRLSEDPRSQTRHASDRDLLPSLSAGPRETERYPQEPMPKLGKPDPYEEEERHNQTLIGTEANIVKQEPESIVVKMESEARNGAVKQESITVKLEPEPESHRNGHGSVKLESYPINLESQPPDPFGSSDFQSNVANTNHADQSSSSKQPKLEDSDPPTLIPKKKGFYDLSPEDQQVMLEYHQLLTQRQSVPDPQSGPGASPVDKEPERPGTDQSRHPESYKDLYPRDRVVKREHSDERDDYGSQYQYPRKSNYHSRDGFDSTRRDQSRSSERHHSHRGAAESPRGQRAVKREYDSDNEGGSRDKNRRDPQSYRGHSSTGYVSYRDGNDSDKSKRVKTGR